jgi:hypothetical protein
MKSNKYLLILLAVLTILAAILIVKNQKGTIPAGIKNVAVENTNEIDKIIIRSGTDNIILEKLDREWRLNHAFEVKKDAIGLFLNMLQRLEIAAPLPRDYQNIAARKLENNGRHVQLFKGNQVIRSFYIDYDTSEVKGTLYMKEGSNKPFFLKLKGYTLINISLLFTTHIKFWRDQTLFKYHPSEILEIRIEYADNQSRSFAINTRINNRPELIKVSTGERMKDIDYKSITNYLYYFSGIEYHTPDTDGIPVTDSSLYFASITITDDSYTPVQVKLFRKDGDNHNTDSKAYDLYRCYGKINDDDEYITLQYVDIDPILRDLDDFLKK